MAELYYGEEESIQIEAKPVTVGTLKGCTLTLGERDELADAIAAATKAAAAAAAAAGPGATRILALDEDAGPGIDPPMKYFVIQPHETGHILKSLATAGVVQVNGKSTILHQLVNGDEITAEEYTLEDSNPDMPPGIWEHLEKKRGTRSVRWLVPVLGMVALMVFGFYQWMVYAKNKHDQMQRDRAQTQNAPISNAEAQAILEDLSTTSEERLAKMAPDDLRRIREEFFLSEDATEEEKAANMEALGKLFGVDTADLLEGGNAADIMAMVDEDGTGRLQYKKGYLEEMKPEDRKVAQARLVAMDNFITEQRKLVIARRQAQADAMIGRILDGEAAPQRGGPRKFKLELEGVKEADIALVNRTGQTLASLKLGGAAMTELPAEELAALRIHETDAVMSYLQVGHRNEPWDAAAVTAIQVDARLRTLKSMIGRQDAREILVTMTTAALMTGCRDPHILLIRERLARDRDIAIHFQESGTPLENAVLIIDLLDTYPHSPLVRSRIYRHGVQVTLDFARQEGELTLEDMRFDVFVDMPVEVGRDWNHWIDLGVADIVTGAPPLTNGFVRGAYAAIVRDAFVTFSIARGERQSIEEGLGKLSDLVGQDKRTPVLTTRDGVHY